jgi:predicted transcriptional regulator
MLDTTNTNHYSYTTKELEIHILGGIRMNNLERMRVTLSIKKPKTHNVLRHSIDLYNDTMVEKLVRTIAERIEIGTSIVRKTLQELTSALEQYRIDYLAAEQQEHQIQIKQLSKKELQETTKFLKSKDLLQKTNALIGQSGVIGEETNRLLMYLIFTSRKTANPLHCISLGSSGVGKTHLQSKVAELIPEEDKIEITVLSANAFYYFNRTELRNKLVLIEDLDGAESVLYPLRELQSKKKITKTVVHKDKKGTTKTIHLTVEGPVSVSGCTTQESIYEDNSNRNFLLYIDESPEQDEKVMQYQRLISAGKVNKDDEFAAARFLRDVQRTLQPIKVVNPYAMRLSLPKSVFKPRRTNTHYLQFIEAITFYKQSQRERKYDEQTGEEYIETTIEDIAEANWLITEVLLRKSDILNGACRNFFEMLKTYLKTNTQKTFTNKEIRHILRINPSNQKRYMIQLQEAGLIQKAKGNKRNGYLYEVANYEDYTNTNTQIETLLSNTIKDLVVQYSS